VRRLSHREPTPRVCALRVARAFTLARGNTRGPAQGHCRLA
jgi:hypothetical protein